MVGKSIAKPERMTNTRMDDWRWNGIPVISVCVRRTKWNIIISDICFVDVIEKATLEHILVNFIKYVGDLSYWIIIYKGNFGVSTIFMNSNLRLKPTLV